MTLLYISFTCITSASLPRKAYSGAIKSKSGLLPSFAIDATACNSFYRKIRLFSSDQIVFEGIFFLLLLVMKITNGCSFT